MESKIGFAFAGAAAYIAQEAALCFALTEGFSGLKTKVRPQVLAGTSSGALNAVALNAILKTADGQASPGYEFFWGFHPKHDQQTFPEEKSYYALLCRLKNEQVFHVSLTSLRHGGFLDTSPLRKLLEEILHQSMGFQRLGDLYLPTYLTAVDRLTGQSCRFFSQNPDHADLDLVDLLMASTAIPIVFPPQRIRYRDGRFWGDWYFDGGTGVDSLPVQALAAEDCDELYLINRTGSTAACPHKPVLEDFPDLGLRLLDHFQLEVIENTALSLEHLFRTINRAQAAGASEVATKAFLFEPQLEKAYSILNFEESQAQWQAAWAWARKHAPVEISPSLMASWT